MNCSYSPRMVATVAAGLLTMGAGPELRQNSVPVRVAHSSTVVTMEANGTASQLIHIELQVGNDASAQQVAQQSASYLDGVERLTLVEAFTTKPDGRRITAPVNTVRTQLAPGMPNVPVYTNRHVTTVPLPEVAAGDTISVTWRRDVLQPVIPGNLSWISTFVRTIPWDDATLSISVPAEIKLHSEEFGPSHEVRQDSGRTVHSWSFKAPGQATDPAALLPVDRAPRFFASTLQDWPALSRAYALVLEPRMAVTPAILAKADELSVGASDKLEEAKRITDWVSRNLRWVAIYVDNGGYVPHPAEQVMRQGYGDCKDQVMLTVALLRARGIEADPVLINLGNTYSLPGPAVIGAFNHVITRLPQFGIYVDTTAGGSPWGVLPAVEYGKPILPITQSGSMPDRLPVVADGVAVHRLRTEARLQSDGTVIGRTTSEARGPYAVFLRQAAGRVDATGPERAAAELLTRHGTPGKGSIRPDPLDPIGPSYAMSGDFTLDRQLGWLDGDGFNLPTGIRLLERAGDGLIGTLSARNLPTTEPTPCWSGVQEEDVSLALPSGYHPIRLPPAIVLNRSGIAFESRWSFADGVVHNVRRLESRIAIPLCEGKQRIDAQEIQERVRRDLNTRIELTNKAE